MPGANPLLSVGLAATSLTFGFWLGRATDERPVAVTTRVKAGVTDAPTVKPEKVAAIPPPVLSPDSEPAYHAGLQVRLATVAWNRARGVTFRTNSGLLSGNLSYELAVTLGLTADEETRLEVAIARARQAVEETQRRSAAGKISADGKSLVVTVAAQPEVAARIRAELRDEFHAVLGGERLQAFDDLAGADFERSFDRFGRNPKDFIVVLPVGNVAADTQYLVTDYPHDVEEPKNETWGTGVSTLEQLRKHPILGQFFPLQAGEEAGR